MKKRANKLNVHAAIYAFLLVAVTSTVQANDNIYTGKAHSGTSIYFDVGTVELNADVAAREGVDPQAIYAALGWDAINSDNMVFGVGISGFFYDDNESFRVFTVDDFGRERFEKSNANSFNLFAQTGFRFPINDSVRFSLLGGVEWVARSKRSISRCNDCPSEEIDINSGVYLKPSLVYQLQNRWMMGVSYKAYASGDVEDGLMFTIGMSY